MCTLVFKDNKKISLEKCHSNRALFNKAINPLIPKRFIYEFTKIRKRVEINEFLGL